MIGLIFIFTIFLSSSFLIPNSKNITEIDRDINIFSQMPLLADIDSILFEGNENASDRLKKLISDLSLGIMLDLSQLIEKWDGAIHEFESQLPSIIAKYVELHYKDAFKINDAEYIASIKKASELNSMETRILNVIYSIAKNKQEFHLETIFEVVHEKNQDIIIDAIETLINKQIIIPSNK